MPERSYERFCPVARALDVLGERWTLLVVHELAAGPRRFSELLDALRGIGPNLLAARLRRLQVLGAVRRRALPAPGAGTVYELTERGRELRPALRALARWGAGVLAMTHLESAGATASYRARAGSGDATAAAARAEWRVGDRRFGLHVRDGRVIQTAGPVEDADLIVELRSATLERIAVGQLGWEDAHAGGLITLRGRRELFASLLDLLGAATRAPGAG